MADYTDSAQAEAALNNPDLPPAELAALAYAQPSSWVEVAKHKSAYPGLLQWLADVGDDEVRAAVKSRGALRPVIIPAGYTGPVNQGHPTTTPGTVPQAERGEERASVAGGLSPVAQSPAAPAPAAPPTPQPTPTRLTALLAKLPRPFGLPALVLPAAVLIVALALIAVLVAALVNRGATVLTAEEFARFQSTTLPAQLSTSFRADAAPHLPADLTTCPNTTITSTSVEASATGSAMSLVLMDSAEAAGQVGDLWAACLTANGLPGDPVVDETQDGVHVREWSIFFFGDIGIADYGNVVVFYDPAGAGPWSTLAPKLKQAVEDAAG
jgi:hypothetical protein